MTLSAEQIVLLVIMTPIALTGIGAILLAFRKHDPQEPWGYDQR